MLLEEGQHYLRKEIALAHARAIRWPT
jgi:hypothetical protein